MRKGDGVIRSSTDRVQNDDDDDAADYLIDLLLSTHELRGLGVVL